MNHSKKCLKCGKSFDSTQFDTTCDDCRSKASEATHGVGGNADLPTIAPGADTPVKSGPLSSGENAADEMTIGPINSLESPTNPGIDDQTIAPVDSKVQDGDAGSESGAFLASEADATIANTQSGSIAVVPARCFFPP